MTFIVYNCKLKLEVEVTFVNELDERISKLNKTYKNESLPKKIWRSSATSVSGQLPQI